MDLTCRPLRRYVVPDFPTCGEIDAQPELLRALPRRWQGNAVLLTLTLTCVTLAGCRTQPRETEVRLSGTPAPPPSRVAPVFGSSAAPGAMPAPYATVKGKVAMPVFLSEDDALQIIADEAKTAGLTITPAGQRLTLPNPIPVRAGTAAPITLEVDGGDGAHAVMVEFVSREDYAAWQGPASTTPTLRDAAVALSGKLAAARSVGAYGIFYDATDDDAHAGRVALRQQVRDFLMWLRAEGVI